MFVNQSMLDAVEMYIAAPSYEVIKKINMHTNKFKIKRKQIIYATVIIRTFQNSCSVLLVLRDF